MDIERFVPRRLAFRAWNTQTRLLMRLNNIDCVKGELVKRDHLLLQFTGRTDQAGEDLYEMDVVLVGLEKFVITWNDDLPGWYIESLSGHTPPAPLTHAVAVRTKRLCCYFETEGL